ncbi:hypothetical protein [Bdellovibrio bacteriovorus]|uniref:hypothetical protein n=1 Tax=Bdellovibrio bacteriovorus TaxID=959 RepID=UPI0035A60680
MLILFFTVLAPFCARAEKCQVTRSILRSIKERSQHYDVTNLVNEVRKCRSEYSAAEMAQLDQYYKQGKMAEANHQLGRLESAAQYRDVSKDVARIEQLLREGGGQADTKRLHAALATGKKNHGAAAKNCSPVDLRKHFGPPRNQDSIGWCYAFVAADLVSFKSGFRVSAMDMAVNFSPERSSATERFLLKKGETHTDVMGGIPAKAIEQLRNKGFCREKDSPSEFYGNRDLKGFVDLLEKASDKSKVDYLYTKVTEPSLREDCDQKPHTTRKEMYQIIQKSYPSNVVYNYNEQRCQNRVAVNLPKVERITDKAKFATPSHEKRKEIVDFIDNKLNKKLPSAIAYEVEDLLDIRPAQMAHASIIVGRRVNQQTGQCEYLLRNSWGKACVYMDKYQCNSADGSVWIPREDLHNTTYEATSYEK